MAERIEAARKGTKIARSRLMYWALTDADYAAVRDNNPPPRPPTAEKRRVLVEQDINGFEEMLRAEYAPLVAAARRWADARRTYLADVRSGRASDEFLEAGEALRAALEQVEG